MVDDILEVIGIHTRFPFDFIELLAHFGLHVIGIEALAAVVDVFVAAPGYGERRRLVSLAAHLVGVPVGLQI